MGLLYHHVQFLTSFISGLIKTFLKVLGPYLEPADTGFWIEDTEYLYNFYQLKSLLVR